MGETDGMNEGQGAGAGVGKVKKRCRRREIARNAGAVGITPGPVYENVEML